jgi:TrmH family RNA methyltransferase
MLSKNKLKFIHSLERKKNRLKENLFLAEGKKTILSFLQSDIQVREVFGKKEWLDQLPRKKNTQYTEIETKDLQSISKLNNPDDGLAIVEMTHSDIDIQELKGKHSLYLDQLMDPGNLGTIIRISDWFGIEHIFLSPNSVDPYNPKVVQSSMGSIANIKLHNVSNTDSFFEEIEKLKLPVIGTLLEGDSIYEKDLPKEGLIIIGNEANGIQDSTKKWIDLPLSIPKFTDSSVESLNAAVCYGIVISHFTGVK